MRVRKKDIVRRLKFFAALATAALYSDVRRVETWRSALAAFAAFWGTVADGSSYRTPRWIYFRRMRACLRCPVYDRRRMTCGSFLDPEKRDVGCKCFMPAKCGILDEECWLYDNTGNRDDGGWPAGASRFSGFDPDARFEPASNEPAGPPDGCARC